MMRRSSPLYILLPLTAALMTSCGSGKDSPSAFVGEFDGVWDVRYNLTQDDCVVVEPGAIGFVDRHDIVQEGEAVTMQVTQSFPLPLEGTVDSDQSFTAEALFEGDYFGDGIFCQVFESISYTPDGEDSASSLFLRQIQCEDGYGCETRGIGDATRR